MQRSSTAESRESCVLSYIIFRYLHFLAILILAGCLVIENMAIARQISAEDARNLAKVDAAFGISALLVFLFGLTLWLWVGKPAEFYSANPLFHFKLALFAGMGLLSIYPTVFFLRHRKLPAGTVAVPPSVIWLLRSELVVLLLIPVLAVLMARGIGLPA
jgi:putative membrane protein